MMEELQYFSVERLRCNGPKECPHILLILDIHHTVQSHIALLDVLSTEFHVTCLSFQNNASTPDMIHWAPSIHALETDLETCLQRCEESYVCCIAQGFGATIAQKLRCTRSMDILCNPSLSESDIEVARRLSSFIFPATAQSLWYNSILRSTWKENLNWPLVGQSPWLDPSEDTQKKLSRTPTNGTWRCMLNLIQTSSYTSTPDNIVIFTGSETKLSALSPEQLSSRFPDSRIQYQIFSGLRQELLLAESVQQDILRVCKEQL